MTRPELGITDAARGEVPNEGLQPVARELAAAVLRGSLDVVVQPLVDLRTGRVVRLEALSRWSDQAGRPIAPAVFIRVAEDNDLILALTLNVVRLCGPHLRRWRQHDQELRLAVNLSAGALHAVRFEVDDFGAGYSSLARLMDLPLDAIKIDRQFVTTMDADRRREAIVRAAIALGHDLSLEVVAEGVEQRSAWEQLRALGCDTAQGYHIARPMALTAFPEWLESWNAGLRFINVSGIEGELLDRGHALARDEVLVIDDEPAIVQVIHDILEHEGFSVETAVNGVDALRAIEGSRSLPAVILLDITMPKLDGPAFARELRARGLNVPIVVMTAGPSARRWAEKMRADAYLSKPFEYSSLVDVTSRFARKN